MIKGLLILGLGILGAAPTAWALPQGSATSVSGPTRSAIPERWVMLQFVAIVPSHADQLTVTVTDLGHGAADLYLRKDLAPTETEWDFRSASSTTGNESITVDTLSDPVLSTGTWWIGVYVPLSNPFSINIDTAPRPSLRPGMGAVPFHDALGTEGVTFRVWAPNASAVHVAGEFNSWSGNATPLQPEGNGEFSVDVRDVEAGQHYRFAITNGTQTLWRNDPHAAELTNSVGDSIIVDHDAHAWSNDGVSMPTWNDLVIYEMHVGTFDPDTPTGVGNFSDVIDRLPYLADLGVSALELMPISEFPGDRSWGYNTSHPFSVEEVYGGVSGLKALIDQAHALGIAVLIDVLYNHWGPTDLDLWRFDGWSQGGWGGIYFYQDDRAITPWGDTKPNYERAEVRTYIRDNVLYWLQDLHVDGLRWDSTSTMRKGPNGDLPEGWSLLQWCNDSVDGTQSWKIQIAEDMYDAPNHWITKPTGAGGAGFDSQWDALFVHPIRAAVTESNDDNRNMYAVRDAISHHYNGQAFQRVIYTESHDEVANGRSRVPEEIWPGNAASYYSKKRSTLASALVLTSPGIPMLFMGQEYLEDGFFSDDDPLDWDKLALFPGIHAMYRDMIGLRRNLGGNTRGLQGNNTNVHHVDDGNKVIAFHRWDQGGAGDDVLVIANFKNQAWSSYRIGLPGPGLWQVRLNSDWAGYDSSFGNHQSPDVLAEQIPYDGMPYSAPFSFGPYSALILSQ